MKTADLTGAALDWAVAELEKLDRVELTKTGVCYWTPRVDGLSNFHLYDPSTNWKYGGPIIDKEIACLTDREHDTMPTAWSKHGGAGRMGPTKLIAAMRCYVASKLGDEVEIPEELK